MFVECKKVQKKYLKVDNKVFSKLIGEKRISRVLSVLNQGKIVSKWYQN